MILSCVNDVGDVIVRLQTRSGEQFVVNCSVMKTAGPDTSSPRNSGPGGRYHEHVILDDVRKVPLAG